MVCRPTYGGSDDTPVTAHRVCDVLEHWGMRGAEVGMNFVMHLHLSLALELAADVSSRLRCPLTLGSY